MSEPTGQRPAPEAEPFVPTGEEMRTWYAHGDPDGEAEFDRWLAEHDRAAAAALERATTQLAAVVAECDALLADERLARPFPPRFDREQALRRVRQVAADRALPVGATTAR